MWLFGFQFVWGPWLFCAKLISKNSSTSVSNWCGGSGYFVNKNELTLLTEQGLNMAKTYYSCTKIEHKLFTGKVIKAGTIFSVSKHPDGLVACTNINGLDGTYYFSQELCRKIMVQPSVDLNSIMEESFLQCEANYC